MSTREFETSARALMEQLPAVRETLISELQDEESVIGELSTRLFLVMTMTAMFTERAQQRGETPEEVSEFSTHGLDGCMRLTAQIIAAMAVELRTAGGDEE